MRKKILGAVEDLPAQFGWKLAGLAVLLSRQILNGSQDISFSLIKYFSFIFFTMKTIETSARTFFIVNILSIGGVGCLP
jgi:hypothetical protein